MNFHQLPDAARTRISDANQAVHNAVGSALDTMAPDDWLTVNDARAAFVQECTRAGINPEDALPHV